jgi:hypothetical protein
MNSNQPTNLSRTSSEQQMTSACDSYRRWFNQSQSQRNRRSLLMSAATLGSGAIVTSSLSAWTTIAESIARANEPKAPRRRNQPKAMILLWK